MTAFVNKGCLFRDIGSLQQFLELIAPTAGSYAVFFAMKDDNGRILRVDIHIFTMMVLVYNVSYCLLKFHLELSELKSYTARVGVLSPAE